MQVLGDIIIRLLVWLIAAPVHEFAHAWVAVRLGDDLPEYQGRLTLDPRAHLDPLGTILVALAGFGWAKPVQFNPTYLRYGPRMGTLLVALAGPLANLALAVLFAIPVRLGLIALSAPSGWLLWVDRLWFWAIYLNLILLFFNLLPVAPLDGFKVALGLLPADLAYRYARTEPWGIFVLLLLLFIPGVLAVLIGGPAAWLMGVLTG